jgi:hypothetical protein
MSVKKYFYNFCFNTKKESYFGFSNMIIGLSENKIRNSDIGEAKKLICDRTKFSEDCLVLVSASFLGEFTEEEFRE